MGDRVGGPMPVLAALEDDPQVAVLEQVDVVGRSAVPALRDGQVQRLDLDPVVSQLSRTAAFPEPAAKLAAGWIWKLEDVKTWARETGRL